MTIEQAEKAKQEQEEQNRMQLTIDDMRAEGMSQTQIDAELERQSAEKAKVEPKKEEKPAPTEDAEKLKKEKEAADLKAAEDKKNADVIKDMIFAKEREEKRKAQEAAVIKAREERKAKMTPEQIAAENTELEAEREKRRQSDIEVFSVRQDAAFERAQKSIPPAEWEAIMPEIQAFIDSPEYDEAVKNPGLDPVKFTGEIVQKAKERAVDKLIEMRLKAKEADKAAQEKIENLKEFGGPKSPPDTTAQESELDQLEKKALTTGLTGSETERMLRLQGEADSKRK